MRPHRRGHSRLGSPALTPTLYSPSQSLVTGPPSPVTARLQEMQWILPWEQQLCFEVRLLQKWGGGCSNCPSPTSLPCWRGLMLGAGGDYSAVNSDTRDRLEGSSSDR